MATSTSHSGAQRLGGEQERRQAEAVTVYLDGRPIDARAGESVAAALLAVGQRVFRITQSGAPRGPFCNMGVCFDCLLEIDGRAGVRACMTPVRAGMQIRSGADDGLG